MENFLFALEDSAIGLLISSSIWGYPIALSLHALGMGVVVGISVMFGLRSVGFVQSIPRSTILPYWRLAIAGFIVNLASGTALFFGSAASLATNWAFIVKLICLCISVFLTARLVKVSYQSDDALADDNRLLAFSTLIAWAATIIFGRIIGYIF